MQESSNTIRCAGIHSIILGARLLPGPIREALLPAGAPPNGSSMPGSGHGGCVMHVSLQTGVGLPDFRNWLASIYSGVWSCEGTIQVIHCTRWDDSHLY